MTEPMVASLPSGTVTTVPVAPSVVVTVSPAMLEPVSRTLSSVALVLLSLPLVMLTFTALFSLKSFCMASRSSSVYDSVKSLMLMVPPVKFFTSPIVVLTFILSVLKSVKMEVLLASRTPPETASLASVLTLMVVYRQWSWQNF